MSDGQFSTPQANISFHSLQKHREAQESCASLWHLFDCSQASTKQAELDYCAMFITVWDQSTHSLAQSQFEQARFLNLSKRKRAQLLLNAAPIVGHQRVRNPKCGGNLQLR